MIFAVCHTDDFCCLNITPNILACIISHMTFFSIAKYKYKLFSEIINWLTPSDLASQLSHCLFFSVEIYSLQKISVKIYSPQNFPKLEHLASQLYQLNNGKESIFKRLATGDKINDDGNGMMGNNNNDYGNSAMEYINDNDGNRHQHQRRQGQ